MKTWAQVSESPEFLALPASEQENAREQYFIDVVAPRAPRAELAAVRKQFDADTRIRKQDLPAGMAPSSVQGGRGMSPGMDPASMSVLDSAKLNSASAPRQQPMPQPAAEPAGLSPEWGGVDQPVAPRGSILEQPTRTDVPFIESSRYARQVDDAKQRARQQPGTMRAASRDQSLAFDVNEALPDSAVARGAAAGFASLGRVGIGAARIAADFTGADDAGRMLRGASGAASATEQGAMTGLAGNDKLVADVTSSIMNSAPSLAVGVLGGPALRALFAQSTLAEYNAGRDAGFDPGESLARAGIMGAAEAVGERFGLSEQIRLLKATTKGMPQNELAKVLGSMIAKEIPGEQLTTAMQVLADKIGPAALQPNATFADYLEAAGETLKVTIGQTAVMGGGPAAVSTARNVYRNADRAAQAPESAAAAAIEDASSAYATFFKPAPEAVAPTAARADTLKRFDELAAAFGLNPKAAAAVRQQAGDMLPDEAPGFLARVAQAMNRRGLFRRPVDDASVADLDKRLRAKPDESAPSKSGPTESFTMTGPDGVLYRSEFGPDNKVNWVPAEPTPREPENTNDQPDVPGTAAEPVRPADGGGDLTAGGELAVGPGADAPGDVVRAAAGTGERDRAPDAVADGGGPDAALTIPPSKFTPEQALARMERQAAEDGQRRADTPDFEDREATDILSPKGTAWASKGPAQKRLKELGDGYRLARVSTGWVVKSSGSRLSTETDTTGYKQPEQDAAAPASTPAAGVEPAAAPVAAAPPAPAPDAVAAPTSDMPAAKQQMREVTQRIEALNDEFRAMYRDNIAYFTGDGPSRKLTKGAPQELRDRWDAYKAAKKQAQADYDAASARMSAATPAPAPKAEAPAAAPVAQPAAPAPKPRQPNGSDSKKAEALFKPPQAADTFADGQRVTLNGTSYTAAKATKTAVTLQGEDGKKRLVQVSAPAYGKIKAEVDNQVDKAEAPATQPEVDAVPAAEPVAEAPPARKDRRTMQEKVEAPAKDGEVVASVGDPNAKGERKFYVTMVRGDRVARLAGPFDTKEEAEAMKPRAQEEANKADPRSAFDAFGVSAVTSKEHKPGRLNEQLGIAPSSSPAPEKTTPAAEGGSSPLYASRPLTKASADAIRSWAASQGFKTTLPAEDLHVTVAYSREPMDGSAMKPAADTLTVTGGKRTVGPLGDEGAVVLKFTSPDMQARWKAYRDAGASWDYESYTPHVTITYDGKGVDLSKVEPYAGPIELGPERQEPLNVDKADDYKEAGEEAVPAAKGEPPTLQNISPTADTPSATLQALSEVDDLFALPRLSGTTVSEIAFDLDPTIKVMPLPKDMGRERWRVTLPNGQFGDISIRKATAGRVFGFDLVDGEQVNVVTERPGDNPEDVEESTEDVWIDVSRMATGSGGNQVYAIAGALAHNTGRIFIGDPNGLSKVALRRRSEQMLSLALRYGTTRHLAPHPDQIRGDKDEGVPPLKWVYGDDEGNVQRLVALNVKAVENAFPDLAKIDFDAATGDFLNAISGARIDRSRLAGRAVERRKEEAGGGPLGRAAAAGRTVARAVVLKALSRPQGSGAEGRGQGRGQGRDGLLDRLGAAASGPARTGLTGLFDLSRIGARIAQMGYQPERAPTVQATKRVRSISERLESGKISEPEAAMAIRVLAGEMDRAASTKAANRLMAEKVRGADEARIKLLQARKRGDLDPEAVDFALWAIDQNPALVDTMGLSVKTPPRPGASGDYNPANEVVRLFKGSDNPYTAVHEILHHTERMMPADMQAAIRREWAAALAKAMKAATPEQREALQNIAGSLAGDKPAHEALVKAIQEGPLNYDQHYHLVNPSEFWAVNASRLLGYRFKAKDSVWQRIATWLQEMAQKLKGLLGLRSDAPVLKAIDALLESDGSRQSASMLANKDAVVAAGGVLESQEDGIIRVRPMMLPSGPGWVVAKRDPNVGEMHLGYYRTEPEAREAAERERTEVRKGYGGRQSNRWWTPTPRTTIQSTGDGRLDSVGRDAAVRETLAARANSIKSAEQAEGLEQIPDRVGWCFPCAAQASAAGLGDMVIGRATGISGDVWHAVVMRDGAVYDPTFGLWFEPGVYESLGFAPHTTLAPAAVRDFIAKTGGMAPDARNLKLDPSNPSVAENLERKPNDGKEDRKAAAKALTAGSIRNLRLPAGYVLSDFLGKSQGRLSVWRKTVGTPYDLAQRNTQFKRVFDEIQDFLHDVSHYAAESADRAPRLLPKLDGIRDIVKGPVKAEDAKAIAAPIFEGTLSWARDETGAPVRIEELEARAEAMSAEDKAGDLLRRRLIDPRVLRMWQGLPLEQYEAAIDTRYRNEALRAGVVWSDAELRSMFNLTGERGADGKASGQIGLYDEFRAATDKSLDDLTISAMLRVAGDDVAGIREQVLEGADLNEAAETIRDRLLELAQEIPAEADLYRDRANAIVDMADRAEDLKARGYAPLSRFGTLTLDVVTPDGERQYFGLFETSRERNRMARRMRENFPDANIEMDTLSQEAFKQFAGVTPETLELFGDKIGMFGQDAKNPRADALFQEWLAKAKSNRSGLKRLIYRKGVPGFSEDVGRVLASFVYSNARQTSLNLHAGEAERSIEDIDSGELKDYAIRLNEYVKNPQEEAQALRGLLFVQFLGGSVASAMVNMTQPFMVTLPYLAQYGGAMKASARMAAASKDVGRRVFPKDPGLAKALREAEEDGIVSPQEVFHLQAQAAGKASLMSGDGTALGWTGAAVNNSISRLAFAWGRPFAWAEQFNRRLTFIAAYRTAVAEGINDPAKFAANAVDATQFVYNKGSRPEWARGAVGATLFTFKTYAVNMVELLVRSLGTKEGRRAAAVMLFMMALMAGIDGLPFMEDIEDVIDGFSQRVLDQNFSTKTWRNNLISDAFLKAAGMAGLSADSADAAARFVQKGLTGLPGAPIDVSGRLGMHNLIPGTGLLLKKAAYDRDVSDIGGPAASFAARAFQAGGQVLSGDVAKAALTVAPIAVQNVAKAAEMGKTGYYPDSKERMVVKTTLGDAVSKGVGFQPQRVKNVQDVTFEQQRRVALTRLVESEIADALAKAVVREDEKAKQAALERLQDWNRKNPETPIKITNAQITARAKAMSTEKTVRVLKAAPKELRQSLADAFSREPATQE